VSRQVSGSHSEEVYIVLKFIVKLTSISPYLSFCISLLLLPLHLPLNSPSVSSLFFPGCIAFPVSPTSTVFLPLPCSLSLVLSVSPSVPPFVYLLLSLPIPLCLPLSLSRRLTAFASLYSSLPRLSLILFSSLLSLPLFFFLLYPSVFPLYVFSRPVPSFCLLWCANTVGTVILTPLIRKAWRINIISKFSRLALRMRPASSMACRVLPTSPISGGINALPRIFIVVSI
jgi:hypothetical protein